MNDDDDDDSCITTLLIILSDNEQCPIYQVLHAMRNSANNASTSVTMKVQDIVNMVVITSQMKRGMSAKAMVVPPMKNS
jgi:hypothetical protein